MNAAAYLQNQGWRGSGYSLDTADRGLAKPLLVAKKDDQAGLGVKKHDFKNQWWAVAFDNSLKQLGSQAQAKKPEPVTLTGTLGRHSGLYSSFVKAETLASTISFAKKHTGEAADSSDSSTPIGGDPKMAQADYASGALLSNPPPQINGDKKKDEDKKKSKKRKRETQTDTSESETKAGKKSKDKPTEQLDHVADFIPLPSDDQSVNDKPVSSNRNPKTSKKEKKSAKKPREQLRAERREKRASIAKANAIENKAAMEAAGLVKPKGQPESPEPNPIRDLRGPPHPESIMARRQNGEEINLPGDTTDPDQLRYLLINHLENGREHQIKHTLKRAMPTIDPNDPKHNNGQVPEKKLSYKGEKYKREKAKREAKRDAKQWVDVRANTHLYRPDGTFISPKDRGVTMDEVKAQRQAAKDAKLRENLQKKAKRELKEQMKVQRREARKRIHGEKKVQNHIENQAKYSAKVQRVKREKDEAAAAEAGMTYEAFIAAREEEKLQQRKARGEEQAKQEGITYEELLERRRKLHDERQLAAEAKKLGLTPEEYANQQAEITDDMIMLDNPRGAKSGMGQHHGRSPIDRLWEKYKDEISEGDGDSDSDSDNSNDEEGGGVPLPSTSPTDSTLAKAPTGEAQPLFVFDTVGSKSDVTETPTDPNAPKRVKDLTKEERKARLEQMRKRREERNAAKGVTKLSKAERRKRRARQKEAILNKLTNNLLRKKKETQKANGAGTDGSEAYKGDSQDLNSKQAVKQSRREARKIIRGAKKGTLPQDEIPAELQAAAKRREQNKKGKSRGGRGSRNN